MLDCLPLEIVYQILAHVPYSEFPLLHEALPKHLVEVALFGKLKQQQHLQQEESLLKLVSTNRNEMVAPFYKPRLTPGSPQLSPNSNASFYHYTHYPKNSLERSNESSIPLFFKHMDLEHRIIWLAPDIKSTQYYFEVKDFYVSHGKLILRQQRNQALQHGSGKPQEKVLGSLWDIRNRFPSSRSGSFSGIASQAVPATSSPTLTLSPPPSPTHSQFSPPPSMRLSSQKQPDPFTMTLETCTTTLTNTYDEHIDNNNHTDNKIINNSAISSKKDLVQAIILDACCVLTLNKGAHGIGVTDSNHENHPSSSLSSLTTNDTTLPTTQRHGFPPRPPVPWTYSDKLPMGSIQTTFPWDASLSCGYFVVEQVALSISDFLDFL